MAQVKTETEIKARLALTRGVEIPMLIQSLQAFAATSTIPSDLDCTVLMALWSKINITLGQTRATVQANPKLIGKN